MYGRSTVTPEEFKELREVLDLSQQGLAQILGVGLMTVSRWERGVTAPAQWAVDAVRLLVKEKTESGGEIDLARAVPAYLRAPLPLSTSPRKLTAAS